MNAFTSKDFTAYPVASMNDKDYFNLMHVTWMLFSPLIYPTRASSSRKDGIMNSLIKDSALTYKGVVYNEMKGAYSDPKEGELSYQVFKNCSRIMPTVLNRGLSFYYS